MPVGDLSAWGVAHFLPVVQCRAVAARAAQLQPSDDLVLRDSVPVEKHQLKRDAFKCLPGALGGGNIKRKALVEDGTQGSLLHVRLLLRNSLSLGTRREINVFKGRVLGGSFQVFSRCTEDKF